MYGVNQLGERESGFSLCFVFAKQKVQRALRSLFLSSAHTGQWETVRWVASAIGLLAMSGEWEKRPPNKWHVIWFWRYRISIQMTCDFLLVAWITARARAQAHTGIVSATGYDLST